MTKTKILLITAWFPPTKGVAVNRMESFVEYLSSDNDVTVLTLGERDVVLNNDNGVVHYIGGSSFWNKIKHKQSDGKFLHHLKSLINVLTARLGVSSYGAWKRKALKRGLQLNGQESFDILISSYAPVEAHEIAYEMKLASPDLIWIADMRDEMSGNPFASENERSKLRQKEKQFAPFVDVITSVAEPILNEFKTLMPEVKEFIEVRNGYNHNVQPKSNFNEVYTIVYAGTFYGKRKPDYFFQSIQELLKDGDIGDDIKFKFLGTNHNFTIPAELERFVEFIPPLPYKDAIEEMAAADCNLMVNPPLGTKGQFSGKIFDYASVQKPILAFIDLDDVAADLIRDYNIGIPVGFDDVQGGKEAIRTLYGYWQRKEPYPVKRERIGELHRKFQVEKLNSFIRNLKQ
ncbi:MAG: hypothetical protein EP333_02430 [Bacteroidetes bacterium]|nr:MAG: hypothetical protein EP333_02430 [Bacteroidota bacterium]